MRVKLERVAVGLAVAATGCAALSAVELTLLRELVHAVPRPLGPALVGVPFLGAPLLALAGAGLNLWSRRAGRPRTGLGPALAACLAVVAGVGLLWAGRGGSGWPGLALWGLTPLPALWGLGAQVVEAIEARARGAALDDRLADEPWRSRELVGAR